MTTQIKWKSSNWEKITRTGGFGIFQPWDWHWNAGFRAVHEVMCASKTVRSFLPFLSFLVAGFQLWLCPNPANYSPKMWAEHAGRVSFMPEVVQKTQWWAQRDFMSLSPAKAECLLIFHLERAQAPQKWRTPWLWLPKIPIIPLNLFMDHLLNERLFSFPVLLPTRSDAELFLSQFTGEWFAERADIS